jgi:hypothetical protein
MCRVGFTNRALGSRSHKWTWKSRVLAVLQTQGEDKARRKIFHQATKPLPDKNKARSSTEKKSFATRTTPAEHGPECLIRPWAGPRQPRVSAFLSW